LSRKIQFVHKRPLHIFFFCLNSEPHTLGKCGHFVVIKSGSQKFLVFSHVCLQGKDIYRKKQDPPTIDVMFVRQTPWGRFGEELEPVRDECETDDTTNTNDEEVSEDSKNIEHKSELEPQSSGKPSKKRRVNPLINWGSQIQSLSQTCTSLLLAKHLTSDCFLLPHFHSWNSLACSSLGVSTFKSTRILNNLLSFCLDLLDTSTEVAHSPLLPVPGYLKRSSQSRLSLTMTPIEIQNKLSLRQ
jgi:hypothetical protein